MNSDAEYIEGYAEQPESSVNTQYTEGSDRLNSFDSDESDWQDGSEETVTEEFEELIDRSSREEHEHEGDTVVENDLTVGGVLRARRIVHPWGGMFYTLSELKSEYPLPHPGMWAIVGPMHPRTIYVCREAGEWEVLYVADGNQEDPERDYLTREIADALYALVGHTHNFGDILGKPSTLEGYGIKDAYTKTEADGRYQPKGSYLTEHQSLANYYTKVEVDSSLAGKADKTTAILAGAGLSGGGTLSADRTLSLSTSGVVAGTYTKLTVDIYGRATAGGSLVAADIPVLAISKISGLQNALDGKVAKAGDVMTGQLTVPSLKIGSITLTDDGGMLCIDKSVYSLGEVSAKGLGGGSAGSGGSEGGSGVDEDRLLELLGEWGYATQAWVNGRGFLTQADTDLLYQPKGNYLTEHQSLSDYYTKTEADGRYQPKGSYLTAITKAQVEAVLTGDITSHTHSQYLTAHQSLANYVTLDTAQTVAGKKTFSDPIGLAVEKTNWNEPLLTNSLKWLSRTGTDVPTGAPGGYWTGVSFATSYVGFQLAVYGGGDDRLKFRKLQDNGVWHDWYDILHSGNYASTLDTAYVKKSGDTMAALKMTGALTLESGLDSKLIFNNTDGENYSKISFRENGTEYGAIISNSSGLSSTQRVKAPYFEAAGTTLCPNLNADLLDGLHADVIRRAVYGFAYVTGTAAAKGYDLNTLLQDGGMTVNYGGMNYWDNAPAGLSYGGAICFKAYGSLSLFGMMAWDINHKEAAGNLTRNLWWRSYARKADDTLGWGQWRQIAFTDSNVASASNLATTRTLWGQNFNGEGNVSGDMYVNGNLYDIAESLNFKRTSWNYITVPEESGVLSFNIGVAGTAYTKMCILNNGNVGIGTTSPEYKLDVAGTARVQQKLYLPQGVEMYGSRIYSDGINLNIDRENDAEMIYLGSSVKVFVASGNLSAKSITIGGATFRYDATRDAVVCDKAIVSENEVTAKG